MCDLVTVKDREVVRAGVFAFALPHFSMKVGIQSVNALHRFLAI